MTGKSFVARASAKGSCAAGFSGVAPGVTAGLVRRTFLAPAGGGVSVMCVRPFSSVQR